MRKFTLVLFSFVMSVLLVSCEEQNEECLCVRSQLSYAITINYVSTETINKIEDCHSYISKNGSLSFLTANTYSILKNEAKQKEFILSAVENGVESETVLNYDFVNLLLQSNPSFKADIQNSSSTYYNTHMNIGLRNKIETLFRYDQEVRAQGSTIIDSKEISDVKVVDAYVLSELDAVLSNEAFTERSITMTGTHKLWMILLHSLTDVSDGQYQRYRKALLSATNAGALNPQYLASIIDRRRRFHDQKAPLYYEYNLEKEVAPNLNEVNGLRYDMGLEPLLPMPDMIKELFSRPCKKCL